MAKTAQSTTAGGPLLDIRNLKIEATVYPPGGEPTNVTIVDGVSLTLERGKVLGLIGESGAGKSTIGLSSMGYGRGGVRITGGEVCSTAATSCRAARKVSASCAAARSATSRSRRRRPSIRRTG